MDKYTIESTVHLFNGVVIKEKLHGGKQVNSETWKKGYIIDPSIYSNFNFNEMDILKNVIENQILLSGEKLNQSFHKSWRIIKESSIKELIVQQLVHYFTTYGFDNLGMYNDSLVYIPNEKLEVPQLEDDLLLYYIKAYTVDEVKEKIQSLLNSGIALKQDTLNRLTHIIRQYKISIDFDAIKNKEIRVMLADELGEILANPTEFLRYLVWKQTGQSLLIKSPEVITQLKVSAIPLMSYFSQYDNLYGFTNLATIFNRFKPLFLAMKSPVTKTYINKISKLSKMYHKPMPIDYLNSITEKIEHKDPIDSRKFKAELGKVNTFRKIRLMYALQYRMHNVDSILYRVRNGKSYATDLNLKANQKIYEKYFQIVYDFVVKDVKKKVKGVSVYLPSIIEYGIPSSEKQFTGNYPNGTNVEVLEHLIFGVHWYNNNNSFVDLDLSLIDENGQKLGWDASYRTKDMSVLFSGDMTSAPKPNGASEMFYLNNFHDGKYIVFLSYYNRGTNGDNAPFNLFVGSQKVDIKDKFNSNYMLNPNKIVARTDSVMERKSKILGYIVVKNKKATFYFSESDMTNMISARDTDAIKHAKKYYFTKSKYSVSLRDMLGLAGAQFVDKVEDAEINLAPDAVERDTLLKLFY